MKANPAFTHSSFSSKESSYHLHLSNSNMEYLPGSYESKLNILFKPISKVHRNTSFLPNFPILIPSPSIDQNILESNSSPAEHHPFGPFYENLYTTTTTSTPMPTTPAFTTTTDLPILETILDLDLDGNIAPHPGNFDHSPPPDYEALLNKTLSNVSAIVNEFLTSPTPDNGELSTTILPLFDQTNSTEAPNNSTPTNFTISSTTVKPQFFRDLSPIASPELLVTYGFFVLFLAIIGIISNSATIHVLFKESINLHIKKHYTNMTILSLALVNLMASIFVGFGGGLNVMVIGFGSISGNRQNIGPPVPGQNNTPVAPSPTPFHISNYDMANSSMIATLISAYANVTFAELPKLNESLSDNQNWTEKNISQIFPSIHRRQISRHLNNASNHQNATIADLGGEFCRMQCFCSNLASFVTIWTLAIITADRFFAHTWPIKYNEMVTRQKFAILIAYIWLQGIFYSSLSIEFWTRDELLDSGVASGFCHCSINWFYIPRNASMGVTFCKLLAYLWMSIFPYTIILLLGSALVYHLLTMSETVVTSLDPSETRSPLEGPVPNPVNRFFQSNPQQDQMIWRVMPPPLSPNDLPGQYGNPPLKELFSSTFAGTQIRRSRLWEMSQMKSIVARKSESQREATTQSVLTCYLAVIVAYIWLQTVPGCVSFLLFVSMEGQASFLVAEMVAFLFKLIGFSVNAGIYFWLRQDFHDAFSGLFRQLCACEGRAKTGPSGQSGVIPGVVVGEEW